MHCKHREGCTILVMGYTIHMSVRHFNPSVGQHFRSLRPRVPLHSISSLQLLLLLNVYTEQPLSLSRPSYYVLPKPPSTMAWKQKASTQRAPRPTLENVSSLGSLGKGKLLALSTNTHTHYTEERKREKGNE